MPRQIDNMYSYLRAFIKLGGFSLSSCPFEFPLKRQKFRMLQWNIDSEIPFFLKKKKWVLPVVRLIGIRTHKSSRITIIRFTVQMLVFDWMPKDMRIRDIWRNNQLLKNLNTFWELESDWAREPCLCFSQEIGGAKENANKANHCVTDVDESNITHDNNITNNRSLERSFCYVVNKV